MANPKWCITFYLYDNKYYDRKFVDTEAYITLEEQMKDVIISVEKISFSEEVKIFFVYTLIDYSEQEVYTSKYCRTDIYEKTDNGFNFIGKFPPNQTVNFGTNQSSLQSIIRETIGETNANSNILIDISHGAVVGINAFTNIFKDPHSHQNDLNIIEPLFQKDSLALKRIKERIKTDFKKIKIEIKIENQTIDVDKFQNIDFSKWTISKYEKSMSSFLGEVIINSNEILQILTLKEINDAIKNVLGNKKLDLLVLDNCVMQNIFTQYELKSSVDYLIASQSGITYPGYNYVGVIENLIANLSTISNKDVANSFCDLMRCHPDYNKLPQIERSWSFSAIKLEEEPLENIAAEFNNYLQEIVNLDDYLKQKLFNEINSINSSLFAYDFHSSNSSAGIIDFSLFFQILNRKLSASNTFNNTDIQKQSALVSGLLVSYYGNINVFKSLLLYNAPDKLNYIDANPENIKKMSCGIVLKTQIVETEIFGIMLKDSNLKYRPSFIKNLKSYSSYLNNLYD